jgi:hypothetical protein
LEWLDLVTYDLVGTSETSQDYQRLIDAIHSYGTWGKVQKSVFLIRSERSAGEIFDHLWAHMDSDDRLLVISVNGASKWINEICERQWLQNFVDNP